MKPSIDWDNKQPIHELAGWNEPGKDHIRTGLKYLAVLKFGEYPHKKGGPTQDKLANRLINSLSGAIPGYRNPYYINYMRIFIRVLMMNELYRYTTTGIPNKDYVDQLFKSDSDFYPKSYKALLP